MVEVSKCPSRKVNPIPYGGGGDFFRHFEAMSFGATTQPTSQERYPPANPGRLVGRLAPSQSLTTLTTVTLLGCLAAGG